MDIANSITVTAALNDRRMSGGGYDVRYQISPSLLEAFDRYGLICRRGREVNRYNDRNGTGSRKNEWEDRLNF